VILSGVMPLRNVVRLGYPVELALRSLRLFCDELVVLVDPTSDDDTYLATQRAGADRIVESVWDMDNHNGQDEEIARQTGVVCAVASGDWVLSLQADEVLHEKNRSLVRDAIAQAEAEGVTCLEMVRLYFFGDLSHYRGNWTVPLRRLYRNGHWKPDPMSGAMQFLPVGESEPLGGVDALIYHYSRVGDPMSIARRVRNLDLFYHQPETVAADVPPYDFSLRKLDTYVVGHVPEPDPDARLLPFAIEDHPAGVREHFGV
jgi:hypothetical protein